MDYMKKVSVIVPIYNAEQYLSRCIESILGQSFKELELILIDDGSTDKSGEICDYYKEIDSRVSVIHKKNEGVARARNDGIKTAGGDYVIFADADDVIPIDAYDNLYAEAIRTNADIVIGDISRITKNGSEYCHLFENNFFTNEEYFIDELVKTDLYRTYCPRPYNKASYGYGGPWNKFVKRALLIENDVWFDESVRGVFDDIIYTANILLCADSVSYISSSVYDYYIYDNSLTQAYKKDILEINNAIFSSWNKLFDKYNKCEKFSSAYYANVLRRFDESLGKFFFNIANPMKNKEIKSLVCRVINTEPYSAMTKKIEYEKLTLHHKILFWAILLKSVSLMQFAYYGVRVAKKCLGRI